ncbi:MAG: phosphoglycerate kinase [Alphaproteobacteria bacterium]
MSGFRTLDTAPLKGARALIRVDLNVPTENGVVTDVTRLERIAPTLKKVADSGAKAIILAHFGRPKGVDPSQSLRPVVTALSEVMKRPIAFAEDCIGPVAKAAVDALAFGEILVLENTRFHKGEEKNDPEFVKALAANGDLWVADAFSAAHRAHASTEGLGHVLPAYAGLTMQAELEALNAALGAPKRPVVAIVGGAKVSTKLELLGNLSKRVDKLVIGGGMANTFLAAKGVDVGKSLCEHDLADTARAIVAEAAKNGCEIVLPVDVVAATAFKANAPHREVGVDGVASDEMILDIGQRSVAEVVGVLSKAKTLVWNGPFGAFELEPFDAGTVAVATAAAELTQAGTLLSVAGGGDTVAALNQAEVTERFTYVSTAGGAFLEWMEGKPLPGVEILSRR